MNTRRFQILFSSLTANKTSLIKLLVHLLSCYLCWTPTTLFRENHLIIYTHQTPPSICVCLYISSTHAMLVFQPVLYWEGNVLRLYGSQGSEVRVLQDG